MKIKKVKVINKYIKELKTGVFEEKNKVKIIIALLIVAAFLLGLDINKFNELSRLNKQNSSSQVPENKTALKSSPENLARLQDKVLNKKGYIFKIRWGDLGKKMAEDGVLDKTKLAKAVVGKDSLPENLDKYFKDGQKQIELNQQNAQFWVDVLWGLGLANKNEILEKGSMVEGNQTANFASTGGYTIGVSQPMDIYSKHSYIKLSSEQQKTVEEIANNIYRPCCGNSTAFPDCNHGMAMLGLIELMVSQGFSKEDIYKTALAFNSYWFPETYLNIAYHFDKAGRDYAKVSAKELLSKTFSSAMGYATIAKEAEGLQWPALKSGGSCGA